MNEIEEHKSNYKPVGRLNYKQILRPISKYSCLAHNQNMNTANVASENVVRIRDWRTTQTIKRRLNSGNV